MCWIVILLWVSSNSRHAITFTFRLIPLEKGMKPPYPYILDCNIIVCEFKLQSCYYIHFQTHTLGERHEPPYPYILDCNIIVCEFKLQSCYYIQFQTHTLGERHEPPYPYILDCNIIVCEFKLQSCYYIHFQTNTLRERYEAPYPLTQLNCIIADLPLNTPMKVDMPLNKETKTRTCAFDTVEMGIST